MESMSLKITIGVFLSALLVLLTTQARSYLTSDTSGNANNAAVHEFEQPQPGSGYGAGANKKVELFYESTPLAAFARKHRAQLPEMQKYRKRECGTIVSVSKLDCTACELFVTAAVTLVQQGGTQQDIISLATKTCVDLHIEDHRVCVAVCQEFKDELFGTLIGISLHPTEVCGYVLGTECGAPFNPDAMWNVTFPDTPKPAVVPPTLPKPGSPTMKVLHLTDFHLDPEYLAGANADCGEPLCCRASDGFPKAGDPGAGKYGDYRNCDANKMAVDNLFQHLTSIQDEFDYVMFTGDIPPHNIWNQSRTDQTTAMETFTTYMTKYLPKKQVYASLGNHESAPVNSFPPPFVRGNNSIEWLYKATADSWQHWLPNDTMSTVLKGGYWSYSPLPGLRLISLNMNMCNNQNWWLLINTTDPGSMLNWFIGQLQMAEDKGEKVHVLGHIFPGCGCCLKPWSWNYYKIVNRYESTIVEQFFGHTHSMGYEVFYDLDTLKRPLGVVYMPGSVTTYSNLNPGFRIYEIDGNYNGSTWRVQDYTNYYMNLTSANMYGNPTWQKEYSAKAEYGMTSLFPKDWNDLIYKMKTDDNLFLTYCRHVYKSAPNTCEDCSKTATCRTGMLCQLKTGRNGDPNICKDL